MKKITLLFLLAIISISASAQSVPAYVDTTGLLAWYSFSGNANNDYGTTLNGSVLGPVLTADRFGNPNSAYYFNGKADHILIDTAFFNVGWSNYTISWWMKNDTLDNELSAYHDQNCFNTIPEDGIAIDVNWGLVNKYSIWVNADPSLVGTWNILPGSQSHDTISDHVWNHFVFEKQNDTAYSFYINGKLDSTYVSKTLALSYYCRLNIGNIDSAVASEGMWGTLDDYGIWTRALSGCEIQRLFNSGGPVYITKQPANDTAALLSTSKFSIVDTGIGNTYQWQANKGAGFTNLSNTAPYSGVTTPTLTVTGITAPLNGTKYRCTIAGAAGCTTDTSASGLLIISHLGVNNVNTDPVISIAPNPTTGYISIIGAEKMDIKIYNSIGQVMKEVNHVNEISISNLPTGLYLIKLFNAQGQAVYAHEVIKQ